VSRGRLIAGFPPGLPQPVVRVPFGNDDSWRETFGLSEAQVRTLAALIAAEAVGMVGATARQAAAVIGMSTVSMAALERGGWVEQVARVERSTEKVWRARPRAQRELGLLSWHALQETA
jgi:hypothetical protein